MLARSIFPIGHFHRILVFHWVSHFGISTTGDISLIFTFSLSWLVSSGVICITTYHPTANGTVEHFHHWSNAAIKAYSDCSNWFKYLPLILLGIWPMVKEGEGYTSAELVYGMTHLVWADDQPCFITTLSRPSKMCSSMSYLSPAGPRQQNVISHVPKNITTWMHVFVRNDGKLSQP